MLEFFEEQGPLRLVAGDSAPAAALTVYGIAANPAGATATFSLFDLTDTAEIDAQAASVGGVASYVDHDGVTRWKLTLTYASVGEDLDTAGSYYGRFAVTLPASAGTISAPPDRSFTVLVYP